ncbi:hypothetical protein PSTT_15272 [Puccinia striiformis]|uniref:Uncharacterized protein n=1 Tax=Puccinia striiformis TaxID=27350 RepID=A0A2S4UIK0_9BASI|nr:hypothetical protein PSTT_15272 [Puccinia striiformis]
MLSLSRCLGRTPKTATFKPDQTVEDDLPTSTEDLTVKDDMLTSSELDITKVKEENEKELPEDPGALSRSTTSGRTQPGKNPPRSSVLSWCSVNNVKKLALPTKAVEQSQSMQESPTTPTQAISPTRAAHPRIKFSDIGSILSLSIPEEGEEHALTRRGSYNDDPFAPPNPRVARYGSFSTTSQADRSTLNSSVRTNNVPEAIHLNQSRLANPCLPDDVCLPNIDRFSKLDFNECDSNWMKYSPVVAPLPVRSFSTSSSRASMSPTLTYRPNQYPTAHSSDDGQQIPFPQLQAY